MTNSLIPLVIIGAGGLGREILDLVRDVNRAAPTFDLLGFLDDGRPDQSLLARVGATHLGPTSLLGELDASYVIGIGDTEPRRRVDALARSWARSAATLVHPLATVGGDVELGPGVLIAAGVRLTTHLVIGRHTLVNFNSIIGHDTVIEDFATLHGGVNVGGWCVIEEGATLGLGSVVLPYLRVGRGATVGAGAVVVRDVPANVTVVGAGARPTLAARPLGGGTTGD